MNEEGIKREKRRRRRIRNQIFAYITLVIIVIMTIAALYFGTVSVVKCIKDYNNKVSEAISEAESNALSETETEEVTVSGIQTEEASPKK